MGMTGEKSLLPAGLKDVLYPEAAHEAAAVDRLVAAFAAQGYVRIKPPLVEFEETLLSGTGAAVANQTFRLMDPVSQRMMGVRADMTTQVARIAVSRLAQAPRPLRLCYAGQVLQVRGSQLRPERQFTEVGAELIGDAGPASDAEVVVLAADALSALGVAELSIDLGLPTLVGTLARSLGIDGDAEEELRRSLDRKDAAAVAALDRFDGTPFVRLLRAAGPADEAVRALSVLDLPPSAAAEARRLEAVVELVQAAAPDLRLTVDPTEHRGFEYHTGVSFTVFSRAARGELGRGGRYRIDRGDEGGEPATGLTFYLDPVLRAAPPPVLRPRLFIPAETPEDEVRTARAKGWITVRGLRPAQDPEAEARRLGCSHARVGPRIVAVRAAGRGK
jgi:ATP phosphoribosyltransferase regulatory subunit